MKAGDAVMYDGGKGEDQLALVLKKTGQNEFNLLVFDNDNGASTVQKAVPRRDEGGGHTWKPVN